MSRCRSLFAGALLSLLAVTAHGAERELGRISGVDAGEVAVAAFELGEPGEVEIEATVLRGKPVEGRSQVWLLDAESRELVWEPGAAASRTSSRYVHRWRQAVALAAGRYELCYFAWSGERKDSEEGDGGLLGGVVREMVGFSPPPEAVAELGATVHGRGTPLAPSARLAPEPGELASIRGLGDDELVERGFALSEPATVEVYAVGELGETGWADWGWLVDVDSRRLLWEMSWDNSSPGGGWEANRRVRTRVELGPGTYAAGFQTDPGHSMDGWRAPPPYDPLAWGLRVRCVAGPGCATARAVGVERLPRALEIARLTGLRDDERRELPFRIAGSVRLRVYALGEGARRGLWDRGWIERADTGERVWQMAFESTRPAGGSAKNLRADAVVELPAGDYLAVYETDDSHSAGSGWNARPPLDADRWGMTLLALPGGLAPRR